MVSDQKFCFWCNYFARGRICVIYTLYTVNHSGKYIEINFDVKIPF